MLHSRSSCSARRQQVRADALAADSDEILPTRISRIRLLTGRVRPSGRRVPNIFSEVHARSIPNRIPAAEPAQVGRIKPPPVVVMAEPVVQRCLHRSVASTKNRGRQAYSTSPGHQPSTRKLKRRQIAVRWRRNAEPRIVHLIGRSRHPDSTNRCPATQHRSRYASAWACVPSSTNRSTCLGLHPWPHCTTSAGEAAYWPE